MDPQIPKWNVARGLLAGAIAASLLACSAPPPAGETVRVAVRGPMVTFSPWLAFSYEQSDVDEAIFDGLVKLDSRGRLVPDLATAVPSQSNGGISPDGRTIVYRLRHGVRWHDGEPFTSSDVAFTYRLLRDPHVSGPNRAAYRAVSSLATPDAYTVRVRLVRPFAAAVSRLFLNGSNGEIVPAHLLAHSRNLDADAFGLHPVGTGPYRFVSWQRSTRVVLAANRAYFAGAPAIGRLEILEVPDADTRAGLVRAHRVDLATLRASDIGALAGDRAVRLLIAPTRSLLYLAFNLRRAPLDRPGIRRALAAALDRPRLVRDVSLGTARVAETLVPPWSWAYEPANGAPAYDPARARAALEGRSIAPQIVTFDAPMVRTLAVLVQAQWRAAGVASTLRIVPGNLLYGDKGLLATGRYDVAILGQGFEADPDMSEYVTTAGFPPAGQNYAGYSETSVDRWSAAALQTGDPLRRRALYGRIQQRLNRDLPYVPIAWISAIYAVNARLSGFDPDTINSDFWNVASWRWRRQ